MSQSNSNASHVLKNVATTVLPGGVDTVSTSNVLTATAGIPTILSSGNAGNLDDTSPASNYNDDYSVAVSYANAAAPAPFTQNIANVLLSNVNQVNFLPTEGALRAGTTGEFNPAAAATAGNYFNAASWTVKPTVTGNASAFTLTDTNDGSKTVTLSENISGSPFTTGNGGINEVLTFRGTANDVLTIKHNVSVANVPATTNSNSTGSAVDVRQEAYAESYAKQGVTSNYAKNTSHKYTEANGNQALNDALSESYVYKDAGLTITSSVKTAVSDGANINGAEKIVESNVANYSYQSATGKIDYIVTDTRNLAQVDQRTWTNTTVTNVAKFTVTDKTVAANPLTVEASGIITGTTTNLAPVFTGTTARTTTFAPTNAKFHVFNANYDLTIVNTGVADQFKANALNQNVFDNVLGLGNGGTLTGLGNGGTLFAPINDATNQPVVPATLASTKYLPAATFFGTDFSDVIKVIDTAAAPFPGNIKAGSGNDSIIGGFGNDTISGDTGDDSIIGGAGGDELSGNNGNDNLFGNDGNDGLNGQLGSDTLDGGAGNDIINGGKDADALTGGDGSDTFLYTAGEGSTDTITDFTTGVDKISVSVTTGTIFDGVKTEFKDGILIIDKNGDGLFKVVDDYSIKMAGTPVAGDYVYNATGTSNSDIITGNVGDDTIDGKAGNDTIDGGAGNDSLIGGVGSDSINGGAGIDTLAGGAGADSLTGGADKDTFKLTALAERGDVITDFQGSTTSEKDVIDLAGLDANAALAGNQPFTFITTAFGANATGQLRFDAATNSLLGSTNADATPEFTLLLTGVTSLVAADLVLV